ncbi:hypothetical protein ABZ883_33465 [Streptomyces sp. NPDC046977]|uniref:hypothetical protein n=1 Tax=Streptomyces sp. NPDC046977 TaxID=3154703 RepID=UPI0033D8A928
MSHRKHVHVVGTLLFTAALAACSGSATPPASAGAPPATRSATGSPAAAGAPAAAPPGPGAHFLAKEKLGAALLPLSDMPAGWTGGTGDGLSVNQSFCDYTQPHEAQITVDSTFRKGSGGTAAIATVQVRQYATPSDAAEVLDAMEQALQSCRKQTHNGSVLTYARTGVDKLGERALGVRVEDGGSTTVQQFVLDGPALINAGTRTTSDADADTTALLLRKQVDRYEAAALG